MVAGFSGGEGWVVPGGAGEGVGETVVFGTSGKRVSGIGRGGKRGQIGGGSVPLVRGWPRSSGREV